MLLAVTHSWCLERSGCLLSASPAGCSSRCEENGRLIAFVLSDPATQCPLGLLSTYDAIVEKGEGKETRKAEGGGEGKFRMWFFLLLA